MRFFVRRVAQGLLLLLVVSACTYSLTALTPGDPLQGLRLRSDIAPEALDTLRRRHGLDRPLPTRYVSWLAGAVRGDLGYSVSYGQPVLTLLAPRIRNTLLLGVTAMAVAWLVSLPIGLWTAASRRRSLRLASETATSVLLAIPDLVLALVVLLIGLRFSALPAGGMLSERLTEAGTATALIDLARHLLLPTLALALATAPTIVRHVVSSVTEVLASPLVDAARARGVPRGRLLVRHVLPAAANPLLTLFGFSIGTLLSAGFLVEIVMSWPGVGPLALEAILARDLDLVLGVLMASTGLLIVGNLVADLLLHWVDPRLRSGPVAR